MASKTKYIYWNCLLIVHNQNRLYSEMH